MKQNTHFKLKGLSLGTILVETVSLSHHWPIYCGALVLLSSVPLR